MDHTFGAKYHVYVCAYIYIYLHLDIGVYIHVGMYCCSPKGIKEYNPLKGQLDFRSVATTTQTCKWLHNTPATHFCLED